MARDLLVELREHDLPPRWDGLAVVWDGWRVDAGIDGHVFICPPPKPQCCAGCGSMAPNVSNRGRVARVPAVTHASIAANDEARNRLPAGERHQVKPKALYRLHAFRCPDCFLDVVWDTETDETWTLDHTDYGDEGSVAP